MGVGEEAISNIMGGIENTGGVKQHNHKKKLRQRFDIIKKLGQGTFGKVQLGINKETGQEVAIKTIKKSKIESEADLIRIRREIQIMSSVQHPNIIHIYEVFENREKMVLVMEYASGGELYDYLSERKVLAEDEARRIFRQIATACYYCHKHKICHRDLKLENILLDENNNAKIADFGLSNVFDEQRLLSTFCGSPLYASPEIVKGTPYQGPEVDCWSLGVLLYTLVYGAMPFDGSNFKRLVKQISQGEYYEPAKPSPASPLIREMLTVNPKHRANIEKICNHWWVNETYDDNCLEISEDLANQTPVRLDVLLTLAPPPPVLESAKLVVTGDIPEEQVSPESTAPTRSQSVGSLMELTNPERRIIDLINEEKGPTKRKLESTVSTDRANLDKGLKRKDKIIKENTVADITVHGTIHENVSQEDASMKESVPLNKSLTQTLSREMDVEQSEVMVENEALEGAACAEIVKEKELAEKKEKESKLKKNGSNVVPSKTFEKVSEASSKETVAVDKENVKKAEVKAPKKEEKVEEKEKPAPKKKVIKKKVLLDKNENQNGVATSENVDKKQNTEPEVTKKVSPSKTESKPTEAKPVERRRSRIFEAAEKFQNMMSPTETKAVPKEKPKKIVIPGVSVDGFKKEFERKASLTSESPPKLKEDIPKKVVIDEPAKTTSESSEEKPVPKEDTCETQPVKKGEDDRKERVKNAVNIISTALDKEGTRKSKSRPCIIRKPPVPFGAGGRSASGNIGLISSPLSPPIQNSMPKPFVKTVPEKLEAKQVEEKPETPEEENKTSSAEITLKSATLPRRKTTKAQIQLNYPVPKPAQMEFKTEVAHNVQAAPKAPTQFSEVVVPVADSRSLATEPTIRDSKERIIPIAFEKQENNIPERVQSPPAKPPLARPFQTQKSNVSQSGSLSRQSTQESDTETIGSNGEPIKKSPREYIIPIAVEGGGYVTPRAGSLEPSDTASTTSTMTGKSKMERRHRRVGSLLSDRDSEDESPFSKLHRHSSFGKDSDTEDSRSDAFHMHRLRSSRPKKSTLEHNDSLSSGEEDDDEGFELLTAENLFSTLLSRVRDLTQRLNVDDSARPGFPSSRLLGHFDTGMWNRIENPVSRHSSLGRSFGRSPAFGNGFGAPWRRSVSRDLASDIDSVFNSPPATGSTTTTARVPRGDNSQSNKNLNLADLDLQKLNLSEEDALALSYLTPGLSRRIQKQLLSQLTPSEVKKLHRTLSACDPSKNISKESKISRKSVERVLSPSPITNLNEDSLPETKIQTRNIDRKKSFLPVRSNLDEYHPTYNFSVRSASIGAEPRGDIKTFQHYKPDLIKPSYSYSKRSIQSPESSISESLSRNDSYRRDGSISELSSRYSDTSVSKPYSKYSSDSSYNRYTPSRSFSSSQSGLQNSAIETPKSEKKPHRISRFLRPDFYDSPKEECPSSTTPTNIYLKEKKEREMETQKVLKEIRDKRRGRLGLRRDRSSTRESCKSPEIKEEYNKNTDKLLKDASDSIKKLDNKIHDYVNVPGENSSEKSKIKHDYVNVKGTEQSQNNEKVSEKKERISRIARPKSYPTEPSGDKIKSPKVSPEKTVKEKSSKTKHSLLKQPSKDKSSSKDDKNDKNDDTKHKNKLLQTIEKKLEKFRSNNSSSSKEPDEIKALEEKKSSIESAIKKLRERSVPRNIEPCTESGLIKRAVSVEDIYGAKPLQASKKSVSKILGLFKKYEEQDGKKKEKSSKKNKSTKEKSPEKLKKETETTCEPSSSNDITYELPKDESKLESTHVSKIEKKERPSSLLLDNVPTFKSDTNLNYEPKERSSKSKLPVTSFRRSLNLENLPGSTRFYKNTSKYENGNASGVLSPPIVSVTTDTNLNRNSLALTDDSSTILSPTDDYMSCDSWSACSDHHHTSDLQSPTSHNGHIFSGDESESVIDRIRRKSFYTRFNEKKRPRKPTNYNSLVYKPAGDYGSLDRRGYDYRNPVTRRSSYASSIPEATREYRPYIRSSSVMNDYVNVPNSYQTYSSRISRTPSRGLYVDDEGNSLDDLPTP